MKIERTREAEAFLETIGQTGPGVVSACDGWTTHEIAAHVTGIAIEVTRHLEAYLAGDPVPATRSFEEREAPLQSLPHDRLLARLEVDEARMRGLVADVLQREPTAVIPWTGRQMAVAKFIPHLRNEHAMHRWDLAGDDDTSRGLLADVDLIEHSVGELGRILLLAGRRHDPNPRADFRVRLRSVDHQDLDVVVSGGQAGLAWAEIELDPPTVELDAAARQLFVWGRRPDPRGRIVSSLTQPDLARLQVLLSGY